MTIPLATTHIAVLRPTITDTDDPYDPAENPTPEFVQIAQGIRAVISAPTASVNQVAGVRVTYVARLISDPTDLRASDQIIEDDGTQWEVHWARPIVAVGLDHTEASLQMVTGYAQ